MEPISYVPIGVFQCPQVSPHESPMQGVMAESSQGKIFLNKNIPLESLKDLSGFERVWIIYDLNQNKRWKPLVQPPRGGEKRGVFATRSPYRPNSIGMSCVRLMSVEGREIRVSEHDLLNETPVLDIKPYLSYADSFQVKKEGWTSDLKRHQVSFSKKATADAEWLQQSLKINLVEIIKNQLSYEPTNSKLKRVKSSGDQFEFSYKTWRVYFTVVDSVVEIQEIKSGYSVEELKSSKDIYGDKDLHRSFLEKRSLPSNQ